MLEEHLGHGGCDAGPVGPERGDGDVHRGTRYYDAAMRGRVGLAMAVVLVVAAGCARSEERSNEVTLEIRQGTTTVEYVVEVAADGAQRQRGLMGRASLPANGGMLFLFPVKVQTGFWMKGTLIPLDIAFISDQQITEIRSMTPCTRDPCPSTTPAAGYDSALEVNAGAFARDGVAAGARVQVTGPLPTVS